MYIPLTTETKPTLGTKQSHFFGGGAMPFFQPKRTVNTSDENQEQEARIALVQGAPQKTDSPVTSTSAEPVAEMPKETPAASASQSQSGTVVTSAPLACDPTPLTRAKFLQEPGATTNDLGLTRMSGVVTNPVVATQKIGKGKFKLQQTAAVMPSIRSAFTDEASFQEGTVIFFNNGDPLDCPGKRYPVLYSLDQGARKKIREGEIEHCTDIQLAFDMSIKKFADEINRLTAARKIFSSQKSAEKYFEKFSGSKPSAWPDVFKCLAKKTEDRDVNKWHTPLFRKIPPTYKNNCAGMEIKLGTGSFPEVGKHPSIDVVKGCPGFP